MRRLHAAGIVLAATLVCAAPAYAEDATITSFDGTPIVVHFFPTDGRKPAPTVLSGPGYSGGGDLDPNAETIESFGGAGLGPLRRAGYNVLTWDPRGFGKSGGTVQWDSPDHEARDVQAIIDWLARRPEADLDAPGDPRVGMQGGSYGGGIQFVTAQREPRIDAIAPAIAWHSLISSVFRDGAVKQTMSFLCGVGEANGLSAGILQPHPQTGAQDPVITRACTASAAGGGAPSPEDQAWFAARGPGELTRRIRAPTLILQGTVDHLFTLQEAIDNHARIKAAGAPLKMLWYCGGHGTCETGTGPPLKVERTILTWFSRWLKGNRRAETGPSFEWIADDGAWRSAGDFPLPRTGALRGTAAGGRLALQPASASGEMAAAKPARPGTAVEVETAPAPAAADVLGAPRLKLTYRGRGTPANTWVWAQVVDGARSRVAGGVVTPIPVVLDGEEHTVERALEPVALRAAPGARYRVQLVPTTSVYHPQRAEGVVDVVRAEAELTVVDAAAPAARAGADRPAAASGAAHCPRGFASIRVERRGARVHVVVRRAVRRPFTVRLQRSGRRAAVLRARSRFSLRPRRGTQVLRFSMRDPSDVRTVTIRRSARRLTLGRARRTGC